MIEIKVFGSSSKGNGYLVKDGSTSLMLEAGINPKYIRTNWTEIEGILVTHEHSDHIKFASEAAKRSGANIYCSKGTAQSLAIPNYRIVEVENKKTFSIGNWKILPFDVEHDAAEPFGYLIQTPSGKKVLFATDTYYIRYKFKGITHAMVECNYSDERVRELLEKERIDYKRMNRLLTSHFELHNVIQFFKENDLSKLEEVHLLHLSDSNSDEELFKKKIQSVVGVPVYVAGGG